MEVNSVYRLPKLELEPYVVAPPRRLPLADVAEPYIDILRAIHHAEAAAAEAFRRYSEPRFVETSSRLLGLQSTLVKDEERHLRDIEQVISRLELLTRGTAASRSGRENAMCELWDFSRTEQLFSMPLRSVTATLFVLLAESMGYVVLHHLWLATDDPEIREVLQSNLRDEKVHIRLAAHAMAVAARDDAQATGWRLWWHLTGFFALLRRPLRQQRALLTRIGVDYYGLLSSSLRFTFDLLAVVLATAGRYRLLRAVYGGVRSILFSAPAVRLWHLLTLVPVPDRLFHWMKVFDTREVAYDAQH